MSACSSAPAPEAGPAPAKPQPRSAQDRPAKPKPAREDGKKAPARPKNQAKPEPAERASSAPAQPAPAAVRNPAHLAQVLTAAEAAVRDPAVEGQELARAGYLQQRVYRQLVRRPQLGRAVMAQLPRGLRGLAQRNLDAGLALASLVSVQTELPDWRIVTPPPAEALLQAYHGAAARFGVEWEYLAAINLVETRMGRIRGRSTAGAQGPMQFMPQTWDVYGRGDINDPDDAIEAAARYLAASGAPGDMHGALYAYNHSDEYVAAVRAYADVMRADPRAYRGYYHWQVYYSMRRGDVLLPVGYGS